MSEIRFIDLFSGIGGFRRGLELSGGYRCVWSNDFNKYANQVYKARFGEENHHSGDIRRVDTEEIPDHNLLCAGFPCQAFSVAGKRLGFKDTRGTLFFKVCRIAEAKRPRLLLLENVKGLLSHEEGRTFATILESLEELGYWWEYQILNSKYFGVPQNRERVFIIGHLGEGGSKPIFPITEADGVADQGPPERREYSTAIDTNYYKGIDKHGQRQGVAVFDPYNKAERNDGLAGAVKTNQGSNTSTGTAVMEPFIKNIPHGYNNGFEKELPSLKSNSGAPDRLEKQQHGRRFKEEGEPMFTLTEQDIHGIMEKYGSKNYRIRRLTPVECERLQGFPDGWTEGISDTQRYKCLGNAVTVNVIEFLGQKIKECLN